MSRTTVDGQIILRAWRCVLSCAETSFRLFTCAQTCGMLNKLRPRLWLNWPRSIIIRISQYWMYLSWNKFTSMTIMNCWKHADFIQHSSESTSISADYEDDDDVPLSIWAKVFNNRLPIGNELDEFVSVDNSIATYEEPM